jgi:hypothetical protein
MTTSSGVRSHLSRHTGAAGRMHQQLTLMLPFAVATQSNLPYELDATSLNTFGECDMNGQLQTPVLAAHYRVMPGRQQLQHNNSSGNGTAHADGDIQPMQRYPDGRTMVGFSFNTKMPTGAEMIFYEFAGKGGGCLCRSCACCAHLHTGGIAKEQMRFVWSVQVMPWRRRTGLVACLWGSASAAYVARTAACLVYQATFWGMPSVPPHFTLQKRPASLT